MSNEITLAEVREQQQVWAERRKLWMQDLIHGDLKQNQEQLSIVTTQFSLAENILQQFCCLGVACQRYREETGDGEWVDTCDNTAFRLTVDPGEDDATTAMPGVIEEWYGLHDLELQFKALAKSEGFEIPNLLRDSEVSYIQNFLYICNDHLNMTLPEIGKVVGWVNDMENHIPDLVSVGKAIDKFMGDRYPYAYI